MTLTVNGQAAEPGCYVEGHWGQYGGVHLLHQAEAFDAEHDTEFCLKLSKIFQAWPKEPDGELVGAYGSSRDLFYGKGNGPWAAVQNFGDTDGQAAMELAEEVLNLLNEHTEGGYWEWYDGECFLRSYICPECGRDATTLRQALSGLLPVGMSAPRPCDFCCDADDPGCFA